MRGKFYTIPGITYFTAKRMKIQAQENLWALERMETRQMIFQLNYLLYQKD